MSQSEVDNDKMKEEIDLQEVDKVDEKETKENGKKTTSKRYIST